MEMSRIKALLCLMWVCVVYVLRIDVRIYVRSAGCYHITYIRTYLKAIRNYSVKMEMGYRTYIHTHSLSLHTHTHTHSYINGPYTSAMVICMVRTTNW